MGRMLLNAIFSSLVLPPGGLALAALVLLALFRRGAGRALGLAALTGVVLLSVPVVATALLQSLTPSAVAGGPAPGAIVVLGGDVVRLPEAPGADLGPLSLERVRAGAALHRATGAPILVSGGMVDGLPVTVGRLMADSLSADFATPARWTEDASPTTWENAAYSAALLRRDGISRVYVVTHAWHMRRSLLAFRRAGLDAVAAPVRLDAVAAPRIWDLLPTASAWHRSFWAMHEWVGLAYYALR